MKAFVVAALIVVFAAVAFSGEEKRIFGSGCDSDLECDQGECCVKYTFFSKCKKLLKEGALCYKGFGKRGFGLKFRCGCEESLTCKGSLPFIGRCSSEGEEGSGDM